MHVPEPKGRLIYDNADHAQDGMIKHFVTGVVGHTVQWSSVCVGAFLLLLTVAATRSIDFMPATLTIALSAVWFFIGRYIRADYARALHESKYYNKWYDSKGGRNRKPLEWDSRDKCNPEWHKSR